ncbi:MAG: hypothetical protein JW983_01640 [Elusimicrobia bacterium]|nr:hypothetical protein [Elusimicrobiota bacterium]
MDWKAVFVEPINMMIGRVAEFVPVFIGFLLILIVGWLVALALKNLIIKILFFLKLGTLSGKVGFSKILEKAGIKYTLPEVIGIIFYWIVILITLTTAVNALGLTDVSGILDDIIRYVPNVILAAFILVLGLFLATFLSSIVVTACVNAGIIHARVLGKVVSIIIVIFSVIIAAEQLNIATEIINKIVTVIVASFGLAFAIAFGLGCKDIAAKWVNELVDSLKKK